MVAERAAQRHEEQQRHLVAVVDLGDGINAGHEARGAHQRRRAHTAHVGAGAQADRRFLAVDRHVAKALVALDLRDEPADPVVGQARDELHAAAGELVGDAPRGLGALHCVRALVHPVYH